jgi:hypothetical protein
MSVRPRESGNPEQEGWIPACRADEPAEGGQVSGAAKLWWPRWPLALCARQRGAGLNGEWGAAAIQFQRVG